MKFTYYFFCEDEECGYCVPIHEKENQTVVQCMRCYQIESKENQLNYTLKCAACNHKKRLSLGSSLSKEETCEGCGLRGKIGMSEGEGTLFSLELSSNSFGSCSRCKKQDWRTPDNSELTCPMCFSPLKQKMSNIWDK